MITASQTTIARIGRHEDQRLGLLWMAIGALVVLISIASLAWGMPPRVLEDHTQDLQ